MEKQLATALAELAEHSNKIEKRLKVAEQLREEVVIPAINELRYAGRRFVDAWTIVSSPHPTAAQLQEANDHIVVARQYLQNADHDCTDAICFFIHSEINRMQKRYGADEMIRVYPDYLKFAQFMQDANRIISGSRETRHLRAAEYKRLETDYITPLIETYDLLRFSESLALTASKKRKIRNGAISVFGAAGTLYGFWDPIASGVKFFIGLL